MAPPPPVNELLPSLLLLPPPPQPATPLALNAAYRAPLTAVLTSLSSESSTSSSSTGSVLIVALTCPILLHAGGPSSPPRSKSVRWKTAQSLLAGVYTIISAICSERGIETAAGGDDDDDDKDAGVDARVVLVDHERGRTYRRDGVTGVFATTTTTNCTPVLDLAAFASTVYPWRRVFHPSTEAGYELLGAYLVLAEGRQTLLQSQLVAVEGGLSLSTTSGKGISSSITTINNNPPNQGNDDDGDDDAIKGYGTVCLGGTFDHLHPGHKLLLHATVLLLNIPDQDSGKQSVLIVGISSDELLKNKAYAQELQSWDTRADRVLLFLSTVFFNASSPSNAAAAAPAVLSSATTTTSPHPEERRATFCEGRVLVRCVNIRDPFGPTISEVDIDAIVVSGETRSGGQAINDKRTARGWKPLRVYEIDVLDARGIAEDGDDDGKDNDDTTASMTNSFAAKISSTAIRRRKAEAKRRD